jgi:hypothetical protein
LTCGDELTRTTIGGVIQKVILPPINMAHLTEPTVDARGRINGFHVLPAALGRITSTSSVTLPAGSVFVLDANGVLMRGAQVRITPFRVPRSDLDAFEAKVEVLDATGKIIGTTSAKSFFPQGWTEAQIQTAIYTPYARNFQAGGAPFFTRMALLTPEGVHIEMRVNGTQSPRGVTLKEIPTAYLIQGQILDATHVPK